MISPIQSTRCTYTFLLWLLFLVSATGAPLRDVPVTVVQPDGTLLNCFASGDEYHNWLHDDLGYTIMQHPRSGYYVYAVVEAGRLAATPHIAGKSDPQSLGLSPRANIAPEAILQRRREYQEAQTSASSLFKPDGSAYTAASNPGFMHNIVVFIRFEDENEFSESTEVYDSLFNNSTPNRVSLYNYYKEASYDRFSVTSTFYPIQSETSVISYRDIYPRAYYRPYNEETNPGGYDPDIPMNDINNTDGPTYREHNLFRRAIETIRSSIPTDLIIDASGNGRVDNISFIISGQPDGWNQLLWPHKWALWSQEVFIHDKRVWDYTLQLAGSIGVGVVAHELFHSLGAPDLYHYSQDGLHPVGPWDIMAFTYQTPQHMSAYMKYRYGKWIDDIPEIVESGTYGLQPLTSPVGNCFKIQSPFSLDEYFIVEYRKRSSVFENILPGEGLLVYRVNQNRDGRGNAQGPPDEVYVYRPNGTPSANGSVLSAHLGAHTGRTEMNDLTNPEAFLSDGTFGGLSISGIGNPDETLQFSVSIDYIPHVVLGFDNGAHTGIGGGDNPLEFNAAIRLTADELQDYYGGSLKKIQLLIRDGVVDQIAVRVWKGGSIAGPGVIVYEETPDSVLLFNQWSTYTLDEPLSLEQDEEYWVGYRMLSSGGYPAGVDSGPMVANKGGWIYLNDQWRQLTEVSSSLNYNFNIRAVIDRPTSSPFVPSLPVSAGLHQNYPNPFNPTTTIQFVLPSESTVRIEIYNMLGQRVERLVNAVHPAGSHSIVWNAGVSSGIYYYRMEVSSPDGAGSPSVFTRSMILLR